MSRLLDTQESAAHKACVFAYDSIRHIGVHLWSQLQRATVQANKHALCLRHQTFARAEARFSCANSFHVCYKTFKNFQMDLKPSQYSLMIIPLYCPIEDIVLLSINKLGLCKTPASVYMKLSSKRNAANFRCEKS
jgi:hypothetical protein